MRSLTQSSITRHEDSIQKNLIGVATMQTHINEMQKSILQMNQKFQAVSTVKATLPLQVEFHNLGAGHIDLFSQVPSVNGNYLDEHARMAISTSNKADTSAFEGSIAELRREVQNMQSYLKSQAKHNFDEGPHPKLAQHEIQLKEMNKTLQNLQVSVTLLQNEMANKCDEKRMKAEIANKMERDEILKMIEPFKNADDRIHKLERLIDEQHRKSLSLGNEVANLILRVQKEFDAKQIAEALHRKADTDIVRSDFQKVDGKLIQLGDLLQILKRNYETLMLNYEKLSGVMSSPNQSPPQHQALFTTKHCVACGRGDIHSAGPKSVRPTGLYNDAA